MIGQAEKQMRGFTIVELLIVIVVIGILAAISIVTYSGMQAKANIVSINNSLQQIAGAIAAHHAENGSYPSTSDVWRSQTDSTKDSFIPGLVPSVVSTLPRAKQWAGTPTFYYKSNGSDYKLLYLYPSSQTIPQEAANDSQIQSMLDPIRTTRGWGYWTPGAGAAY